MSVEILLRNGSTVFACTESKVVEDRIKSAVSAKAWGITVEDYRDRRMLIGYKLLSSNVPLMVSRKPRLQPWGGRRTNMRSINGIIVVCYAD